MVNIILSILMCLSPAFKGHVTFESEIDTNYRCAKYNVPVDFTSFMDIASGSPAGIISYKYYIQYGSDVVIEILDPGTQIDYLPVMKVRWDYRECHSCFEAFHRNVRKYYTVNDTINFVINDSRGSVQYLCDSAVSGGFCDSLLINPIALKNPFLLYISDSIPNIHSTDLFYPDVAFLPTKIVPKRAGASIWTLDEVFYGKQAIDSILSVFKYAGFAEISEEEAISARLLFPIEETESLIPIRKD